MDPSSRPEEARQTPEGPLGIEKMLEHMANKNVVHQTDFLCQILEPPGPQAGMQGGFMDGWIVAPSLPAPSFHQRKKMAIVATEIQHLRPLKAFQII